MEKSLVPVRSKNYDDLTDEQLIELHQTVFDLSIEPGDYQVIRHPKTIAVWHYPNRRKRIHDCIVLHIDTGAIYENDGYAISRERLPGNVWNVVRKCQEFGCSY